MLRPATPLTILLFAAFVLLVISVISTPIVKQIPLASYSGVDFGVLGYCKGSTCSDIEIGYDTSSIFTAAQTSTFDLPSSTRTTLSAILIVHPIAAFFTLIMLVLAATAHLHSPSHSPRFLLGIFILSILTLILALLAFLIDVLLFVPHMAWGSYIVLAATILIAASGIVSCAMRRTLVSRKARKRRIEENAEMNGENYYGRQGTNTGVVPVDSPMVSGGLGNDNKLPAFATFEDVKKDGERTSDERIPLTTRTQSDISRSNMPSSAGFSNERLGGGSDTYVNSVPQQPPPSAFGTRSRDPLVEPPLNHQYSDNSLNVRGRGGMPYRGRGGYGPPTGRGGYGPPPGSRGGNRGGYGNPNGRGGYGPPGQNRGPPGMNNGMMAGAAGGMVAGGMMRGGRGGAPPGYGRGGYDTPQYGRRPSAGSEGADAYARNTSPRPPVPAGYGAYNPDESLRNSLPRAESPPPMPGLDDQGPVGQAIEMDATTGSPSTTPLGFGHFGQLRDSDGDVAGMVGLQQQRQGSGTRHDTVMSATSNYSTEEYVPPRQAWAPDRQPSPLNQVAQPAELPNNKRESADYYEDVDPRFESRPPANNIRLPAPINTVGGPSSTLHPLGGMDGNNSYEDIQSGSRSPAESDRSNFTSVSQRGINPRWNAQSGGYGSAPMPRRPMQQQQQRADMLLNSNPDFQLPGSRGARSPPRRGRGVGTGGGGAYPGGAL